MSPAERHRRIAEVFHEALERPEGERAAFLRARCGSDVELLRQVSDLLGADGSKAEAAGAAVGAEAAAVLDDVQEGPGSRIGPYRLIEQIGEGGFGVVFRAEQEQPVVREVAIKVIKLGMDTLAVVARFDAERQAMAMMDHPNIARALDAGATAAGRPYFVMELVRGEPITDYCKNNGLSVAQRLTLFEQVCSAVQHAHQKGVIHRDLKPSNVLVTVIDGRPAPKVIDFGVAKALRGRLTDKTVFTDLRQMIGTPQYMSPEQAEGSADIDTRADVYALGAILYEMLTDVAPFDAKRLRSAAQHEVQRILREEEPPRPSLRSRERRAGGSSDGMKAPSRLGASSLGDLDWIVMKCLEKERDRRYESADALAQDVRRRLAGEAVLAAPPSALYRARKFVRRHQVSVGTSALAFVLLIAGGIGISVFALREADARAQAELREAQTQQVAAFQARMLAGIDPVAAGDRLIADLIDRYSESLARDTSDEPEGEPQVDALEAALGRVNGRDAAVAVIDHAILRPAAAAIEGEFGDQPGVAASLAQTLADLYRRLDLYEEAAPLQERAIELRRSALGPDDPDTIKSINAMGLLLVERGRLAEAEPHYREALERSRRVLGPDDRLTVECLNNLGMLIFRQGRADEAEPILLECLAARRRVLGAEHPDTLSSISNMGYLLQSQGRLGEAEPYSREAVELTRAILGEDSPSTIIALNNYCMVLKDLGRLQEAEAVCREGLAKCRRVHGDETQPTLIMLANLSTILQDQGRPADAEPYCREVVEKARAILGDTHPTTLAFLYNLATLNRSLGRLDQAEQYAVEALDGYREEVGPEHSDTLSTMRVLASVMAAQGRYEEAEAQFAEAIDIMRRALGPDNVETITAIALLGELLVEEGELDRAEPLLNEAVDLAARVLGPGALVTIGARSALGELRRRQGRLGEARTMLEQALADYRLVLPEDASRVIKTRARLDQAVAAAGEG